LLAFASQLQDHLHQAVAAAPTTCAALVAVLKPVGDSCKSCHEKYR
jgi:cytochrome c556